MYIRLMEYYIYSDLVRGISPVATEYRNAIFQVGHAEYRQLATIDPNCIEIVKPLGKCTFFNIF